MICLVCRDHPAPRGRLRGDFAAARFALVAAAFLAGSMLFGEEAVVLGYAMRFRAGGGGMMLYNRVVGVCANLTTTLRQHGVRDYISVNLSSEYDGEAFERALAGKVEVDYVPYDPAIGRLQRRAVIGGLAFIWPAADPKT